MNDQNETAQLRYLEETAIRLRQNGFTVEPIEDHHLPVCWGKGRLCRISGKGSVLYRQECVDVPGAQDALQTVIDTAKMTSEYRSLLCSFLSVTLKVSITPQVTGVTLSSSRSRPLRRCRVSPGFISVRCFIWYSFLQRNGARLPQ